jgi:hypothetical protein
MSHRNTSRRWVSRSFSHALQCDRKFTNTASNFVGNASSKSQLQSFSFWLVAVIPTQRNHLDLSRSCRFRSSLVINPCVQPTHGL